MNVKNSTIPQGIREVGPLFLNLTPTAIEKLSQLQTLETNSPFLRIRVAGGGCNGLTYKMKFSNESKPGDLAIPLSDHLLLLIDPKSALYLRGSQLDFSKKMIGGGFKFHNPNAKSSCSCGESFTV